MKYNDFNKKNKIKKEIWKNNENNEIYIKKN